MAGQITLKYSGIYPGNTVSVLISVRGKMIQDLLFIIHCFSLRAYREVGNEQGYVGELWIDIRGTTSSDLMILEFFLRGYIKA